VGWACFPVYCFERENILASWGQLETGKPFRCISQFLYAQSAADKLVAGIGTGEGVWPVLVDTDIGEFWWWLWELISAATDG
jgi:hypothetical protein